MKTHSELRVINDYIVIYYSQNYQTLRINTKYKYDKNYCTKALLFNAKAQDFELKNKSIEKLKNSVDNYIAKCIGLRHKVYQKDCLEYINSNTFDPRKPAPQPKKNKVLLDYYDEYLLTKRREIAESSYKNYKTLKIALEAYELHKNTKLTFDSINNKEFCLDFKDYLLEQGLIDITINKRFACLKTFLKYIQEDQDLFYFKPSVMAFSVEKFESEIITISLDELKNLQMLDLKGNEKWQKVLDVFILNCFMGLRYADLQQMKKTDFFTDSDGDYFYKNYNQKTTVEVLIPILPTAKAILLKYDFDIPRFVNAVFNRELKDLLTFHKLFEDQVMQHYKKDGHLEETQFYRRQLISSHTCRRSFITNSLLQNVNVPNLMKATGHKKLSTISRYLERKTDKQDFKKLNE